MPAAEFVYADVDGQIGRQTAGLVPLRAGWNGALPAPGDSARYQWSGWASLDAKPHSTSPSPFIAAANDSRPRHERLLEVLSDPASHTGERLARLQSDVHAWRARQLVPLLARARSDRADVEQARTRLLAWDGLVAAASTEAVLYVAWERGLVRSLAARDVPADLAAEYAVRAAPVLLDAIARAAPAWFNSTRDRDRLLIDALAGAHDEIRAGPAATATWGTLNAVTFNHALAISEAARARFNIGPSRCPATPIR